MSITITQIAKLVGVSRGTVDRVIHQRGRVAPEVEKRIRDIMDEIEKGNPFFQLIHSGMKEATTLNDDEYRIWYDALEIMDLYVEESSHEDNN